MYTEAPRGTLGCPIQLEVTVSVPATAITHGTLQPNVLSDLGHIRYSEHFRNSRWKL